MLVVLVALALLIPGVIEIGHYLRFGHFIGYGLHTDIVRGNSDIGYADMYFANVWNLTISPFDIEGCVFANDVPGRQDSVFYRWDVQKWDSANQRWMSLHGADTWVPNPFGGSWNEEPCFPQMTHIGPFQSHKVAWVYKDWVTTGEPVRMAIHTSVLKSPNMQQIIYTKTFVVKRHLLR
jgi:hypothetical protein